MLKLPAVLVRVAVVVVIALALAATATAAGDYEPAPVVPAGHILPANMLQGKDYKIVGKADGEGMLYSLTLWTPFATYETHSLDMLLVRLGEVRAMEQLRGMMDDPLFLEGMGEYVGKSVDTVASAVRRPVKTVREIPLGLTKFANKAETRLKEGKVTGETGPIMSAQTKRDLARKLGVDPYTDNAALQQMMNQVAGSKNFGKLAARVAMAAVGGDFGTFLGVVSGSTAVRTHIYDVTAPQLQDEATKILEALGCNKAHIGQFMSHPQFTVTRRYAIAAAMKDLGHVKGINYYVGRVLNATNGEMALFYQRQIEMAAAYNRNQRPLVAVGYANGMPVYEDKDGARIAFVPVDVLYWNKSVEDRLAGLKKSDAAKGVQVWITGMATPKAMSKLVEAGLITKEKAGILLGGM